LTVKGLVKTQSELARALGLSRQRVGQLLKAKKIRPMPKAGWDPAAVSLRLDRLQPHRREPASERCTRAFEAAFDALNDASEALELARTALLTAARAAGGRELPVHYQTAAIEISTRSENP